MRKQTGNIQDRGSSFRIRYYDADGIRHQETYKKREEAEAQLAIRLGELAAGMPVSSKPNTVLFGELADDVVTDYEVNEFRSTADIETRFRLHIIPVFGRRKAAQITTAQLKTYIRQRQAEGAAAGTINRELEAINHTFKLAIAGRKLLHAPHVPKLREDNVRTGFFTIEEVDRLCQALVEQPVLASMVRFAFLTGWRLEEIRRLEWRQVDFARNEIRLDVGMTKNREGRVFPMTEELRRLLERQRHLLERQRSLLKTNLDTKRAVAPKGVNVLTGAVTTMTQRVFPLGEFRKTWKTACHKAGLPCIVEPIQIRGHVQRNKDGSPKVRVVKALRTFHDLRRSFAREMDRMGVRQGAIMKLGGWKTDSVFRRYNVVSDADLRDAIEKVDGHRNGSTDH